MNSAGESAVQSWISPSSRFSQNVRAPGSFLDPNNANRYAHAGGDPINNTDPTGRYSWGEFGDDVKGVASTVGSALSSAAGALTGCGTAVLAASAQITYASQVGVAAGPWGGVAAGTAVGVGACLVGAAAGHFFPGSMDFTTGN